MRLVFVTHADTGIQPPRTLSAGGRLQAVLAAHRIRDLLGSRAAVRWIAASQAVRTLDTVLTVATELGATVHPEVALDGAVELTTVPALNFRPPGQLSSASIDAALQALDLPAAPAAEHIALVGVHADIAGALPGAPRLRFTESGWFRHERFRRPVIALVEHRPGHAFAESELLHCEGSIAGRWESLLEG